MVDDFRALGIRPSKGVLLYGPPGTGKTMLAKAVSSEAHAQFLPVSISSLIKGEVGESEKAIAALFQTARRCQPCVIFIDEVECLFSDRDNSGDLNQKIFSQLLFEIDSLEWPHDKIVVMVATNHPQRMDPALLRPGRIDRLIAVGLPDDAERFDILRTVTRSLSLSPQADLKSMALQTKGFSGADIQDMVRRAVLVSFHRQSDQDKDDLQAALDEMRRQDQTSDS
ncbi:P-loop containing nucleoside triphosphate hydrolase protein [Polychytrium aggregatum]|uniref:P-loop containing nucleoside triphosphate hydrolase protein n=1 Tax=Polychytrium aggregatum TaxID=110093 RepID=UPI0022FDCAAA|nr:P-loop containing nucleoside triphosphate hydrolase protein [Polychytrium aggregatum]KAI9208166.1 P-loop containing nucleoside triphosphate hydrolase protein [Polychytrium aggregatum]